ncbi:MAG: hypothetical protein WCD81_02475 [Candidatus Bathyarchaeia archaeon]
MTEQKQKANAGFFKSKYWKMLLVLVMGILLFGAPYAMYILQNHYTISTIAGFGAVFLGLLLMWYLIKTKVIS